MTMEMASLKWYCFFLAFFEGCLDDTFLIDFLPHVRRLLRTSLRVYEKCLRLTELLIISGVHLIFLPSSLQASVSLLLLSVSASTYITIDMNKTRKQRTFWELDLGLFSAPAESQLIIGGFRQDTVVYSSVVTS